MAIATKALALDETLQDVVAELQRITSVSVTDRLNDLSDVNVSNAKNGQILKYNSLDQKWENKYPHTYSMNEQRVATWIDGKPVYEKTVDFGALPNTTTKRVSHNITNIDYIVDYKAICRNNAKTSFVPIPRVNANASLIFDIVFTDTYIEVQVGTDRTAYSMYVTLRYTKTTD